jgi:hypothetical protein
VGVDAIDGRTEGAKQRHEREVARARQSLKIK